MTHLSVSSINTKAGDTEVTVKVNADLTAATARVLIAPDLETTATELDHEITDEAAGEITIDTSELTVGTYLLEIEVTQGTIITTFPGKGQANLVVWEALG